MKFRITVFATKISYKTPNGLRELHFQLDFQKKNQIQNVSKGTPSKVYTSVQKPIVRIPYFRYTLMFMYTGIF